MDWEQIWREHRLDIYKYIYFRLYNRQEAEDITQEAFLKVIRAEQRYEGREVSSIVALLKTTARNLIVDNWRKQNNASKHIYVEIGEYELQDQQRVEDIVEQRDEVARALNLLNQEQQKIVKYRMLDGYSIAETAQLLGKSISSVKTTQHRSVQYLRQVLQEEERADLTNERKHRKRVYAV